MERKVCFITGSGSGNGRGMALRMAEHGYDIALHHSGRDPETAENTRKLIAEKGVRCEVFTEDLFLPNAAKRLFDQFRAKFDRLDVFVNNSGRTMGGKLLDMNEETFDYVDRVNWKAAYFCVQQAGLFMKEKNIKGSIIIIASNHHLVNFGWSSAYASMKEALVRFTKYAALEFSPYGIRVNCIAPGLIYTKIMDRYSKRDIEGFNRKIPAGYGGQPSDIVPMIQFLADKEKSRFIVGQTIFIDGGQSIDGAIDCMLEDEY